MSHCIKCGSTLKPNAKFCGKCGQAIRTTNEPELKTQETEFLWCPSCRNMVSAGIHFCKNCGAALHSTIPVAENNRPAASTIVQQPMPAKRKRKWARVLITFLFMVPAIVAVFYFLGTFEKQPDEAAMLPEPVSATESLTDTLTEYAVTTIEDVAETTEQVFLQSDTAGLARILAPTTLERQRAHFTALQPHMKTFGEDFRNRKVLCANELYAIYEFECSRGKFTVDFCLGEDGTWKLMRF
ncbi:Double zinc ribbon [anaerobic digester metagenome]